MTIIRCHLHRLPAATPPGPTPPRRPGNARPTLHGWVLAILALLLIGGCSQRGGVPPVVDPAEPAYPAPVWSPDGERIAFVDDRGGQLDIYIEANGANKNLALGYVQNLDANGGTPARAALETAFEIEETDMIFFLSDGHPSDGTPQQILELVRSLNPDDHVVVHTIGLGENQAEDFLRRLAEENGGKYVKKG